MPERVSLIIVHNLTENENQQAFFFKKGHSLVYLFIISLAFDYQHTVPRTFSEWLFSVEKNKRKLSTAYRLYISSTLFIKKKMQHPHNSSSVALATQTSPPTPSHPPVSITTAVITATSLCSWRAESGRQPSSQQPASSRSSWPAGRPQRSTAVSHSGGGQGRERHAPNRRSAGEMGQGFG